MVLFSCLLYAKIWLNHNLVTSPISIFFLSWRGSWSTRYFLWTKIGPPLGILIIEGVVTYIQNLVKWNMAWYTFSFNTKYVKASYQVNTQISEQKHHSLSKLSSTLAYSSFKNDQTKVNCSLAWLSKQIKTEFAKLIKYRFYGGIIAHNGLVMLLVSYANKNGYCARIPPLLHTKHSLPDS